MLPRFFLTAVAIVALALPAYAQPAPEDNPDTGYIGGGTLTPEIDACESRKDVSAETLQARASEHYDRGDILYTQGDYEGAILEFVAAYCDAPHHEMLKNIAKSFERQVNFDQAVAYLSRYILELPTNRAAEREKQSYRIQVLRNLPARVRVATVPAGAKLTLTGETGVNARGLSDDKEPMEVLKGRYSLNVEKDGYEPVTQTIEVRIGQPYSYYFRLEPKTGTVRIITKPANARIFIDKRLVGIGNYTEKLPIGMHSVTVERHGWVSKTKKFEITAGRRAKKTIKLEKPPKSGRRQLLVGSTVVGAFFGSGTFATIFEPGSSQATLGALLGIAVGFGGGYYGVPDDIPVGYSSYIIGTTLMGAAEGATISHFIACDPKLDLNDPENGNCSEVLGGATLAAGVGGLLFGILTADKFNPNAGDASLLNSGAMWGSVGGLLFVAAFDNERRLLSPLGFAGLNLGIVAGSLLARRFDYSRGHVALIDLSGLAGTVAGVALVDVVEPGSRSERLPHFALLGMIAGLVTGAYLTRNIDEPKSAPLRTLKARVGAARDVAGKSAMTFGVGGRF